MRLQQGAAVTSDKADCGHEGVFTIGKDGKSLCHLCYRERQRATGRELLIGALVLLVAGIYFFPDATTKVVRAIINIASWITG
jgi:hypothetical protein